jgi:hypothetical protein
MHPGLKVLALSGLLFLTATAFLVAFDGTPVVFRAPDGSPVGCLVPEGKAQPATSPLCRDVLKGRFNTVFVGNGWKP